MPRISSLRLSPCPHPALCPGLDDTGLGLCWCYHCWCSWFEGGRRLTHAENPVTHLNLPCACVLSSFSHVRLSRTVACQASLFIGILPARILECGLPCPPPGGLPALGIEPVPLRSSWGLFTTSATWEAGTCPRTIIQPKGRCMQACAHWPFQKVCTSRGPQGEAMGSSLTRWQPPAALGPPVPQEEDTFPTERQGS